MPTPLTELVGQLGTLSSWLGDTDLARRLHAEELQLAEASRDQRGVARAFFGLGRAATFSGDAEHGRDYYEQGLAIAWELNDGFLIEAITGNLAGAYSLLGDYDQAMALNDLALAFVREYGSLLGVQIRLTDRGELMLERGNVQEAKRLYAEAFVLARDIGIKRYVADLIGSFAKVAAIEGELEREVLLRSAVDHARHDLNYRHLPVFFSAVEQRTASLRAALGDERFEVLVAAGLAMTTDEAIAYALQITDR